nr:hypothetical protein [Tanacetum cinerariifolium]
EGTLRKGLDHVYSNQVRKARTKARSFQIAKGERSRKKNGVQKIGRGVFHMLGDKEKNVSAHSRCSERKSYYSSCRDTESCYQSSRSKETEIAFEKYRHKIEYSRRTEEVSESERSAGGHWKSNQRSKSRVLRMIYPNHGYAKKHILLLLRSVTLTSKSPNAYPY